MRLRLGISLVELLAVLTGCSIVLGLTTSLLHQTMRSQSETRHCFDAERDALRLSRQFRLDVHAAREATTETANDGNDRVLQLTLADGGRVDYECTADEIIRIQSQTGEPTARETYRLGESLRCQINELDQPPRWNLKLTATPLQREPGSPGAAHPRSTPLYLSVEAALGRDQRFAESNEQETPQ